MNLENFTKHFEAVYFDGNTDKDAIAAWCGGMIVEIVEPGTGKIRDDMYMIDVPGPGGYSTAMAGSYIFKDGPSFFAMPKPDFLLMVDPK